MKKLFFLLVLSLLAISFTACSDNDSNKNIEPDNIENEVIEETEDLEMLVWPQNQLATLIPTPSSPYGTLVYSLEDELQLKIYKVTQDSFYAYVSACVENGFTTIKSESNTSFQAVNQDGYRLELHLYDEDTMRIVVSEPLYEVSIAINCIHNLLLNQYDIVVHLDGIELDFISHGGEATFYRELEKGSHTLEIIRRSYKTPKASITFNVTENASISYDVFCYGDYITIEQEEYISLRPLGEKEARTPSSALDFKYKDYKDVVESLKTAGFTNISTSILYDIVWGWTDEGEVDSVSINGIKDFSSGAIFDQSAEVVVTYHMKEEDDPNRPPEEESDSEKNDMSSGTAEDNDNSEEDPVWYSTNTPSTVSNGNSGVYAYKNKGGNYDVYWIIDFDKGYVYNFFEGNGDDYCDRLKIESGDLNSVLIITYHDDNATWSYGLHFKYVDNPEHLVLQDNDGFTIDFYPTNLSKALAVRGNKTINDY